MWLYYGVHRPHYFIIKKKFDRYMQVQHMQYQKYSSLKVLVYVELYF